jgi:phosphohistidine phosphatase
LIWLLRHGDAEEGQPDDQRRLTAKGEEQSRAAGEALKTLGAQPALCLTSPKVRAVQTAELACEALGVEVRVDNRLRGGSFDPRELAAGLEEVLLVCHEPDISDAIHRVTAESVEVKKGAFAGIDERTLRVPPTTG